MISLVQEPASCVLCVEPPFQSLVELSVSGRLSGWLSEMMRYLYDVFEYRKRVSRMDQAER